VRARQRREPPGKRQKRVGSDRAGGSFATRWILSIALSSAVGGQIHPESPYSPGLDERKRARDSERTKSESITKSAAGLDTIVMGTVFIRNKSEGLTKNAASLADKGVSFVNHGVIGGKG
jgi:hypothetical protein